MRRTWLVMPLLAVMALPGCSSAPPEEQLLKELANLDKETIFERAEALFAEEEYGEARRYFQFLYDSFPNDPLGHRAALRVADTYAVRKDTVSLTEARLRYRDFVNRYPNDPNRDYALLRLGDTYFARRGRPDLDLTNVHEALAAYQQLVNLYPASEHAETARKRIAELREMLAEHEWLVARYYARNGAWTGVTWRLEYLKEQYPDYPRMDQVDELLERARTEVKRREELVRQAMEKARAKGAKR